MKIVADENIPFVEEAFGPLGEITLRPGRAITPDDVRDADALLVRSVTSVNAALLEGSRVRFVGTATIGVDHVDESYLEKSGIAFASAQGSNANSVAEYVLTAIYSILLADGKTEPEQTYGVVGCGNVGRQVTRHLRRLGQRVLVCDPPLAELIQSTGLGYRGETVPDWVRSEAFVNLETIFDQADIITLHVPLTNQGPYPTRYLLNAVRLAELDRHLVINTSRGAVIENAALGPWLREFPETGAVLDVWENEPRIRWKLLQEAGLRYATPHIAGYSFDGKVAGTRMIYEALCGHLVTKPQWDGGAHLGKLGGLPLRVTLSGQGEIGDFVACLQAACDLAGDDRRMRAVADQPADERWRRFDALRKNYPVRREFYNYTVKLPPENEALAAGLQAVGFQVSNE